MGRKTSAWIAGTLGVGLTASIVLAQQMPGSGGAPRAGSGASDASESEPASIYGASSSRGARYLMRNGLDYLQYQQYERALKFLRDAEAKQKELSAREVQELKRGIERAQAGLRAAADATAPYALSDQSRPRNGFTAARPEARTAVAARTGSTDSQVRVGARLDRSVQEDAGPVAAANPNTSRAADDAPGEPIRLASVETEAGARAGAPVADRVLSPEELLNAVAPADPQSSTAEIPALAAPGLPALTAVPSSPDTAAGAGTPPTAPRDGATAPATAPSVGSTAQIAPVQEPPAQAPPPATAAPASAPRTIAPTPIPADVAPAPILLETPDSAASRPERAPNPAASRAPEPSAAPAVPALSSPEPPAAPALVPASDPAAGAAPAAAPATGGLVPAAMQQPAEATPAPVSGPAVPSVASEGTAPAAEPVPAASISPPAVDPDTAPLPPLGAAAAAQPAVLGGTPHRESEEPAPVASTAPEPAAAATSPGPAADPAPAPGSDELPPLPADLSRAAGAAPPVETPAEAPLTPAPAPAPEKPAAAPAPAPPADEAPKPEPIAPAAAPEIPPAVPGVSTPPAETGQPLPSPEDAPAGSAPSTAAAPAPEPTPAPVADPGSTVPAAPAAAADERPIPVPQPEADAPATAGAATAPVAGSTLPSPSAPAGAAAPTGEPAPVTGSSEARFFLPPRVTPPTRLRPFEERRVTEIMARQEREDVVRNQVQARPQPQPQPEGALPREASSSNLQTQTQYDISRAPSPAEARPIKAIPVPEDWVPLAARSWSPQRKYWAAAATCHLPLYFQDAALERYGHPVEQFVGPVGRYLTYPVDDPDQSTQRNQIIQPFFSAGLMALQIAAWPYNAIMDPPWEAQYDLGYYRPGDMVPKDTYWLPLHGYGPPLRGNSY